jgi:hypothetical protein
VAEEVYTDLKVVTKPESKLIGMSWDSHLEPTLQISLISCQERNLGWEIPYIVITVAGKRYTKVYPKVSGLAAWSENCKWYSSLPLGAVVSLFYESV